MGKAKKNWKLVINGMFPGGEEGDFRVYAEMAIPGATKAYLQERVPLVKSTIEDTINLSEAPKELLDLFQYKVSVEEDI